MLRQLVVILAIAVLAAGRRAPNADYVAELLKSRPQTGYSSNIEQDLLLDAVSFGGIIFLVISNNVINVQNESLEKVKQALH